MASKITDFYTQRKSMKNDDMLRSLFSKLDLLQNRVEKIQNKQKEIQESVIRIGKKSSENSEFNSALMQTLPIMVNQVLEGLMPLFEQRAKDCKEIKDELKKTAEQCQNNKEDNLKELKEEIEKVKHQKMEGLKTEMSEMKKNGMPPEVIAKFKNMVRRDEDHFFMSTIQLNNVPNCVSFDQSPRRCALAALNSLHIEHVIMEQIDKVTINAEKRTIRLTASSPFIARCLIRTLASAKRRRINQGYNPCLTFTLLTAPRFNRQRDALYKLGNGLKKSGKIIHFHLIPLPNTLAMKVYNKNKESWIVECPSLENIDKP